MTKTKHRTKRAYTTRAMPDDLLSRLRVLAAVKSHEEKRRITLEVMVNEAIAKGLPLLEAEIL